MTSDFDPWLALPAAVPQVALADVYVQGATDSYLTINSTRWPVLPGYTERPQFSSSLPSWLEAAVLATLVANGDNTETVTYRDLLPATDCAAEGAPFHTDAGLNRRAE